MLDCTRQSPHKGPIPPQFRPDEPTMLLRLIPATLSTQLCTIAIRELGWISTLIELSQVPPSDRTLSFARRHSAPLRLTVPLPRQQLIGPSIATSESEDLAT